LSTKIHAMVDALGNPVSFLLTPGQAHDLDGADVFLPQMQADTLLADRAFDADKRVIEPLLAAGKTPVIPSMPGRKNPRLFLKAIADAVQRLDHVELLVARLELLAQPFDVAVDGAVVDIDLIVVGGIH